MNSEKLNTRYAGLLIIAGMVAGILSVVPAVDSTDYLKEAATNSHQVIIGAIFQFIMALTYLGVGILLYPIIKRFAETLAIGFFSFRIIAAVLVIIGTILLFSILSLSQELAKNTSKNIMEFEVLGNVLKITRDYINHVFMILALCLGNFLLYILLFKTKLIPGWISLGGLLGAVLSVVASIMIMFQVWEVISPSYLIFNVPTAIIELILGIWLIVKGFDKNILQSR